MSSSVTASTSVLSFDRETSQSIACATKQDILAVIDLPQRDRIWFSFNNEGTSSVIEACVENTVIRHGARTLFGDLIMFEPLEKKTPVLSGFFERIVGDTPGHKWLPEDQLREVLSAPREERRDLIIDGVADGTNKLLAFMRGDFTSMTVPFSMFRPSGKAAPDFDRFELDDYGHTLRFGDYEATTDVVLWEVDPEYRKRVKARERAQGQGFGPSLRRLRKQRGLSQSDFPGIDRKTISRIENGEINKPQEATLRVIVSTLKVAPEEIESY